ncbi:MAG: DUF5717 family protein [bacterium]|nr:DUF5717 family protein [bacterium]MDY4100262.1 DUF5717 family protein [Lachnospiraceae bacterium]
MYKRIEELAEGKVHIVLPMLSFTPEQVRLEPVEGSTVSGSFTITSINKVLIKGIVCSTDLRMEIKNPQFQGESVQIRYEFHGKYMQEGDVATGDFLIISNGGEYNLSWSVAVKRLYAETSVGRITELSDFVRLYRVNWREAVHVYSAPGFKRLLRSPNERLFYKLLSSKPVTREHMEEFLVACGHKQRVGFRLSEHMTEHLQLTETIEESVTLTLSDWGYTQIDVSSDADFVSVEKERITTDDFNGDRMQLRYRIHTDRMHAGKNYARLTFSNLLQQASLEITASKRAILDLEREDRKRITAENLQLMRDYERMLSGAMVTGEWAKRATTVLRRRRERGEASDMDTLWCAYAFLTNRQNQEAAWLLDEYRHSRSAGDDREWAFFLYLCSMTEKEQVLLDKLYTKIREIYRAEHEDRWMRFVIMQIADDSPEMSGRQLRLLEQWFEQGMASPVLYAKVASIYRREPYLLLSLGRFELHVLRWMCKNGQLTQDLAQQVVRRAISVRTYSRMLDEILEKCYEAYPQEEMLAGLCAYRIKGQRFDHKVHAWYELAIEHDLQITGLYEAFMASLDPREVRQLPKTVQLYFQYNNHLTYRQKAVLYVNIIANRENQPAVYERYRQIMQDFAESEIMAGHIDDNLAVVYSHVLERMPLTEELAHALADLLYTNKFTCLEEPVTHVVVQQENLKQPRIYPVTGHQAFFPVYPGNYVILLQDAHGRRYALSAETQMERLMNPGRYIRRCLELAPEELPFVLHHMNGKTKLFHMDARMAGFARTLVRSDAVSEEFKSRISPGFLEYCRGEGFAEDIRDYVLKIDFGRLDRSARDRYLESLIQLHMYSEAWAFLEQYGTGRLSTDALTQIVLAQLQAQDMQEDDHLLYFATQCFLRGSKGRMLLEYLCSYYEGPAGRMAEIWKEASEQRIDTSDLEERLLIQMMFSGAYTTDVQSVFASYCAHQGRETVKMAYLTYFAYESFVHERVVDPGLYHYLEQATLGNRRTNRYLRLALMKYYTSCEVLTADQERFTDELVDEYMENGQCFSCFLQLPEKQLIRHHLYDICAVEYRCAVAGSEVWLNYRISGGERAFTKTRLEPVCDGIFLWHVRLLGGQQLEYYISEKSERMESITESHLVELPVYQFRHSNRHERLSSMIGSIQENEEERLRTQMKEYQAYESLTARLFRVI